MSKCWLHILSTISILVASLLNLYYKFIFFSQVELLIPQLQFLDEEGAQAELWELSRVFLDTLIEETGCEVS